MGELVPVPTAFELGKVWYADRMHADWRPRSLEETQNAFRRVGLTNEFWLG